MTGSPHFPYATLCSHRDRIEIDLFLISLFYLHIGKFYRLNERIRARTVRLIDEKEEQVGIVAIEKALELAKERELDLVEVAATANPPVCRLMDFGKFLYQQRKTERKQKKQKQTEIKGIRLSFRTDIHDLETKAKQARNFFKDRNVVKVALVLRGREFAHIDLAREKLKQFSEMLKDIALVEQTPKKTGNTLIMILNPL